MPRPVYTGVADRGAVIITRGLSLVEIMIALVLGLFLMGGLLQMLSSSRMAYRLAESKARAQENGRYALQFLAREMRPSRSNVCRNIVQDEMEGTLTVEACALLADFSNCTGAARLGKGFPLGYSWSQKGSSAWLDGLPGSSSAGAQASVGARWLRGDVLVSWGAVGEGFYAKTDTLAKGSPSVIDLALPIELLATASALEKGGLIAGHLAMITDCNHSDVFGISSVTGSKLSHAVGTSVNKDAAVSHPYNDSAQWGTSPRARVMPFDYRVFFICCMNQTTGEALSSISSGEKCNSDTYRPALCRWSATSATAVVATDIADLRVLYDGRLDRSSTGAPRRFADSYSLPTAATVQSNKLWDRVYSARVQLLVTGGEAVRTSDASPGLAVPSPNATELGKNMDADKRLYEVFSSTIAMRSRTPWYRDE